MSRNGIRKASALVTLALTLAAALALATTAQATSTTISTGSLDWGIKQSFRSYITGPIAHGSITVGDNASTNPDGTFHFPVTGGAFDDGTGSTQLDLDGSVHFVGHDGQLDLLVGNLRIDFTDVGAVIRADVTSVPLDGSGAQTFDGIPLVDLDITASGIPEIAAGTTTWSELPSTVTAFGAPAFAGFYAAGTAFDPASFSYVGPGGKPIPEEFDVPGTPKYEETAEAFSSNGVHQLYYDKLNNVVHALGAEGILAYDADTLVYRGSIAPEAGNIFGQYGNTFDPESGTVFASFDDGGSSNVKAYKYNGSTATYDARDTGIISRHTVVYSSSAKRLYSIGSANFGVETPSVDASDRDENGFWTARPSYAEVDTGGEGILGVSATDTGKLVGTYTASLSGGMMTRKPILSFADSGSELTPTEIPGTLVGPPVPFPAAGVSYGYNRFSVAPNDGISAMEFKNAAASQNLITLNPSADPSGFTVDANPLTLDYMPSGFTYDQENDDLYLTSASSINVLRDGEQVASFDGGETLTHATAGEGRVYIVKHDDIPYRLAAITLVGTAPEITSSPENEAVEVESATATTPVTFVASASADPAPVAQWQKRADGAASWTPIAGANADVLTIDAKAADNGTRYRAIYSNAAGEVATQFATLMVSVNETVAPVVSIQSPAPGSSTSAASAVLAYSVVDNVDRSPSCSIANGASVPLALGPNTISVSCRDSSGNVASASTSITRVSSEVAPVAPKISATSKTQKLSASRGVRVKLATVTCPVGTCTLALPKSVKFKIGKKSHKAAIDGPSALIAGGTGSIYAAIPAKAVAAQKRKRATLKVSFKVNVGGQSYARTVTAKYTAKSK